MHYSTVMNSNTKADKMLNAGDKVTGKYFGVPFSGAVSSRWFNEANHRMVSYHISLNTPISALGEDGRTEVTCTVNIESSRDEKYSTEVKGAE